MEKKTGTQQNERILPTRSETDTTRMLPVAEFR